MPTDPVLRAPPRAPVPSRSGPRPGRDSAPPKPPAPEGVRRKPHRRGPRSPFRPIAWLLSALAILAVLGAGVLYAGWQYYSRDLPDYGQLATYEPPVTTRLHAGDGRLLAEYATENRLFVPIGAMPPLVVQAFVSAEDQNFYNHPGIDLQGLLRIIITNVPRLIDGRRPEGASTITQQVARNFLLTNEATVDRKLKEMILALRMERAYSKERILELYLNQIYLGRGAYGVAAAALAYFNKPLADLTLSEAAFIAGLPKAPSSYDPVTRHDRAVARRDYVLGRLFDDHVITAEQLAEARAEPLTTRDRATTEFIRADYFSEEVRRQLARIYGTDQLYEGGLSVRTTLDPDLQKMADRALTAGLVGYDRRHGWRGPTAHLDALDGWDARLAALPRPEGAGEWQLAVVLEADAAAAIIGFADKSRARLAMDGVAWAAPWREGQTVGRMPRAVTDVVSPGDVVLVEPAGPVPADAADLQDFALRQIPDVEGAVVVMDPQTGRVLAISGGYDYAQSEFNRATQAMRQPGSTFKPFVYLAALEAGYTPATIVEDAPISIDQAGGPVYEPENYSRDSLGPVPMRVGIEKSRNQMTVRLLQAVGLERVRDVSRRFGIYADMPQLYSMGLGAGETTPLTLTAAYAMIANGGRKIEPTFIDRIQDRGGHTVYRHDTRHCEGCNRVAWTGRAVPAIPDDRPTIEDPVTAYQMTSMLEGAVKRGTAAALAKLGVPLAGKTGTSNDYKDAWFVGFTPDLVVGVFVGFDEPRTLGPRDTGGAVALPVAQAFFGAALPGQEVPPFRIPPGVSLVRVDRATGQPAFGGGNAIWEAFRPGTEPGTGYALDRLLGTPGIAADTTIGGQSVPEATAGTGGLY
jgi:penicillin-binding protein 1A